VLGTDAGDGTAGAAELSGDRVAAEALGVEFGGASAVHIGDRAFRLRHSPPHGNCLSAICNVAD
jgi:hypothetical protein